MKHKRGTDHEWTVVRYKGDMAYYACCKCGWYYSCGSALEKDKEFVMYPYCPSCGARKKTYNTEPIRVDKLRWE